jgi:threonine synthase
MSHSCWRCQAFGFRRETGRVAGEWVAVLTGNGLKDPDTAERTVAGRIVESEATTDGVREALGW